MQVKSCDPRLQSLYSLDVIYLTRGLARILIPGANRNRLSISLSVLFSDPPRYKGGHSAAQVNLQCILGSGGQIIYHNHTIWVPNERLGLFVLSFDGPNIAQICAGKLHVKISKKSSDFFFDFFFQAAPLVGVDHII